MIINYIIAIVLAKTKSSLTNVENKYIELTHKYESIRKEVVDLKQKNANLEYRNKVLEKSIENYKEKLSKISNYFSKK